MGLKRRQEEDGVASENEFGIECARLLTPGFRSDDQPESETKEKAGKNPRELPKRICFQHQNIKFNNRHPLLFING